MSSSHHAYILSGSQRACKAFVEDWCTVQNIPLSQNPDIFFVEGETATVDTARSVVSEAYKSPLQSEYRVVVWKLGYLGEEVSNTILKILEELPEKTRMFICVPPGVAILPTVLSRVQLEMIPFEAEDLTLANKFISMSVSDRLLYLESEFFKSEKGDERIRMMELLSALAEVISEGKPELAPEFVKLITYLNQGSATPKYILEYAAHIA
jgi:hypothetical protein